ncbi:VOC family protein [Tessaracoccus coleopterorum]|uniref:VOC family protein n=1 Tax=Tessaracoccus coleopterorum TaxID=2714950 RepID=UPI002F91A3C2
MSTVHITVDDPEAALVFYRDALGLEITQDVANEGYRWITLSSDAQPDLKIVLSQPEPGRSEADAQALAGLIAKGVISPMHLRSDDLDALFAKLASVPGVSVVQEPTDQFWGVRDGALRDPAGNFLRIEQG